MIKKRVFIRTALLSLALFSFAGCIGEDNSLCPPANNVILEFRLLGGEVFRDRVTSVDVGIFDGNGTYLHTEQMDQEAIGRFEGMAVALPPGDYRMVFWGNVNGNTRIDGITGAVLPKTTYAEIFGTNPATTGNGDKVYYGPCGSGSVGESPQAYYSLTVPEEGVYSDVVFFTHAHRSLEIYIKGLSANPASLPTVEIGGLPAGLGYFGMSALTAAPTTVTASLGTSLFDRSGITYAAAMFDTFRFDDMEGIYIVIKDSGGNELYRITLAEAVELSHSDPAKIVIELEFSFMNGSVEVSIPGWKSDETGVDF